MKMDMERNGSERKKKKKQWWRKEKNEKREQDGQYKENINEKIK